MHLLSQQFLSSAQEPPAGTQPCSGTLGGGILTASTCAARSRSGGLSIGLPTTTAVAMFCQLLSSIQSGGLSLTREKGKANEGYADDPHCVSGLDDISQTVVEGTVGLGPPWRSYLYEEICLLCKEMLWKSMRVVVW